MKMPEDKDAGPTLMDGINYTGDKGPRFGARHVQVILISCGVAYGFGTKALLSIAIVAMTNSTSSNPDIPTYDWDNKSVIVSSILWAGVTVNLLGGYLGKRYGPKWFLVGSGVVNSLFLTLIPVMAQLAGSTGVIVCRIFEGASLGFLFPLDPVVLGRWIPTEERSRMSYAGKGMTTLFAVICSVSSGYIADSYIGWPGIFYIYGAVGFTWAASYAFFGVQSPAVHPRITPEEKKYIETAQFGTKPNESMPIKQIFSNIHVWACIIGHTGYYWSVAILTTELSIFTSKVLQFDVTINGTIAALPPLTATISGAITAYVSDFICRKKILSVVNCRRTFHLVGVCGCSLAFIFMTFIPIEHRNWTIVLLCIGNVFILFCSLGGASTNVLDISPKYAGPIEGMSQTTAQAVGLFAPLTVQWICTDESDISQWRIVFLLAGAISLVTAIFFVIFSTDKRQKWETESDLEAEVETIKRRSSVLSLTY